MFDFVRKLIFNIFYAKILCDSCKYDYSSVCLRTARPNARKCPDYKKR